MMPVIAIEIAPYLKLIKQPYLAMRWLGEILSGTKENITIKSKSKYPYMNPLIFIYQDFFLA